MFDAIANISWDVPSAEELRQDKAFWSLYEAAFPFHEREPPEVILRALAEGVGVAVRARQKEETIGLASMHLLRDPAGVFLVYLAIAQPLQSQGLGQRLLQYVWQIGNQRCAEVGAPAKGMIWEVDPPALATSDQERLKRERRIAFFSRQGGVILPCAYVQPPLHGDKPVNMLLMHRPAEGTSPPDAEQTMRLVRAMYLQKYGGVNGIETAVLQELLSAQEIT